MENRFIDCTMIKQSSSYCYLLISLVGHVITYFNEVNNYKIRNIPIVIVISVIKFSIKKNQIIQNIGNIKLMMLCPDLHF